MVKSILKNASIAGIFLLLNLHLHAQTLEFFDDFETGTTQWILQGNWGLTSNAFAGNWGMSESPAGNYLDMEEASATMAQSVDLSLAVDAYVEFAATYNIEYAFDYLHVEVSGDNGQTWHNVYSFTGDSIWWRYSFSIGGFVGNSQVKARMRFKSDQALNYDGFSVDNFQIVSYDADITPPLIIHQGPEHYEGSLQHYHAQAEIIDISEVAFAELHYWVDTVFQGVIPGNNFSGNQWLFTIPPQTPGAWVDYYLIAGDTVTPSNIDTTQLFQYVAGNTIKYDNAQVDFVQNIGSLAAFNSAAVRISLNGETDIVTGLIRTYTDPFIVNNDLEFHIWRNDSGVPGTDLIVPFIVQPEANSDYPHRMTRIDLRPYADSLAGVSGDVFIGYTSPNGWVYTPQTSPGVGGRTYLKSSTVWNQISADFHFRVVTTEIDGAPDASFSFSNQNDPLILFSDASQGNPTSWLWDFNDMGNGSTLQNPSYAFSNNGTYFVCLTVDNGISNDTHCHLLTISNSQPPIAGFEIDYTYSPEILFADTSLHFPTEWHWTLGENGATWNFLNPSYTYTTNDTFTVCLHVSNALGADSICQEVVIDTYTAPEVSFSFNPGNSPTIQFTDESSNLFNNAPSYWSWNFDDGSAPATQQNPAHIFPSNGVYQVCLTAGNPYGENTWCNNVPITSYIRPLADFTYNDSQSPLILFTDNSSSAINNTPTSWSWDFGDGTTSQLQDPEHQFLANGIYIICLVASNAQGSDTVCYEIEIDSYAAPTADFSFQTTSEPSIAFLDESIGSPTEWFWEFNDNGQTSTNEHPVYTFSTNGGFEVCLTVTNYLGSDTHCDSVFIDSYLPAEAQFSYTVLGDSLVQFTDLSTQNPLAWSWDFGYDSQTSNAQHPTFAYPVSGSYYVCLSVENNLGWSAPFCDSIAVEYLSTIAFQLEEGIVLYPNPGKSETLLELPANHRFTDVSIYNADGKILFTQQVQQETQIRLSFEQEASGVYWIQLTGFDKPAYLKFIRL